MFISFLLLHHIRDFQFMLPESFDCSHGQVPCIITEYLKCQPNAGKHIVPLFVTRKIMYESRNHEIKVILSYRHVKLTLQTRCPKLLRPLIELLNCTFFQNDALP